MELKLNYVYKLSYKLSNKKRTFVCFVENITSTYTKLCVIDSNENICFTSGRRVIFNNTKFVNIQPDDVNFDQINHYYTEELCSLEEYTKQYPEDFI